MNSVLDRLYIDRFVFTRSSALIYIVSVNNQLIQILISMAHYAILKLQKIITSSYEVGFRRYLYARSLFYDYYNFH